MGVEEGRRLVRLLSILFSFHSFKLLTPLPIKVIVIGKTLITVRASAYCGDYSKCFLCADQCYLKNSVQKGSR